MRKTPASFRSSHLFGSCSTQSSQRVLLVGCSRIRLVGGCDLDNLADRVIKPMFRANGLRWKGWHAYRRGLATNLKELGVPDTTIQCVLRHENVNTTQRFYIKTASAVAVDAMKKLEEKISGTAVVQ